MIGFCYDYLKVLLFECGQGFDVDYFYLPYGGELVPHLVEDKYDYPYDIGLSTCLVDLDFTVTILRR